MGYPSQIFANQEVIKMAKLLTKKNKDGTSRYAISFTLNDEDKSISFSSKFGVVIRDYRRIVTDVIRTVEVYGPDYPLRKSTSAFIDEHSELKEKLRKVGLILAPKQQTLAGLWDMLEDHAKKMNHKDSTVKQYQSARKWFFRYFEEERRFETVTEKDAEEFNAWLHRQNNKYGNPISPRSVAGYVKTVKAVFNLARKDRLIDRSPFESIKKGSFTNPARQFEVSASIMPDILDACPSQAWRVLFVLWHFGGLRKSEPLLLKWEDILWNSGKIRVHSPKTKRYDGHAERFCPLFPGVRRELEDLSELAEQGTVYVFPDEICKRSDNGIYNAVERIVRRAGFTPWERLINNMRATRVSEMARAGVSERVRTAWFGHSERVSRDHYQIEDMLIGKEDYDWASDFRTLPMEQPVIQLTGETVSQTVSQVR